MIKRNIVVFFITASVLLSSFLPFFGADVAKGQEEGFFAYAVPNEFSMDADSDSADSSVIIDFHSRSILYSKNADTPRGMASTTKIMTALVAIENGVLDSEFVIPKEATGIEGSSVYLVEGEKLTLRQLLYCLMLESGNDAAAAIAMFIGGSVESFVEMMNQRAMELGLKNTHFANPHGLSDENHYTTAYELALITAEAMEYPVFREICSTKKAQVPYNGAENGRYLNNHNKLLFGFEGATGVKTGYTKLDGRCLVSSAERDGMEFICVTLHDDSPTENHMKLLNQAFSEFERINPAKIGDIYSDIPIEGLENVFLRLENRENVAVTLPKGAKVEIRLSLPETVSLPVYEGDILGKAVFIYQGKEVYIINLESTEEIQLPKKNFWEKIFGD